MLQSLITNHTHDSGGAMIKPEMALFNAHKNHVEDIDITPLLVLGKFGMLFNVTKLDDGRIVRSLMFQWLTIPAAR
jgi:hypothetical protein